MLAAGAANAFNCYYDRDIDRLMHRTRGGRCPPARSARAAALVFGVALPSRRSCCSAATTTLLAAALAAGAIFYYASSTRWCSSGTPVAAPSSVGSRGGAGADRLGRGHRLAGLAGRRLLRRRLLLADAALLGAGHAVQARTTRGPASRCCRWSRPAVSVGRQSVVWAWVTVAVSLLLWPVGADYGIGWLYTIAAAALGGWFILESHRLLGRIRREAETKPMQLFHVSISYLALLMVAIVVDVLSERAARPRECADGAVGRSGQPDLLAPGAAHRAAEIEALIESGCPVVTYLPGGRLLWHDEDDAWPAWADARSTADGDGRPLGVTGRRGRRRPGLDPDLGR